MQSTIFNIHHALSSNESRFLQIFYTNYANPSGAYNEDFDNEFKITDYKIGDLCVYCSDNVSRTFRLPLTVLYDDSVMYINENTYYHQLRRRRKRDTSSDTTENTIRAHGSLKITKGLEWKSDYNFINTTAYKDLENTLINMVSFNFLVLIIPLSLLTSFLSESAHP